MKAFNLLVKRTVKKGEKLPTGKTAAENQRVDVGTVEVHAPTMDEIVSIVAAAKPKQATDDKGNVLFVTENDKPTDKPLLETDDDGLPVYDSEGANWIYSAIVSACKAGARNKLQKDSIEPKDGLSIPSTLAELFAASTRGPGAALANLRDCKNAFAEYVATLGKSEATANLIVTLFNNKQALSLQTNDMKAKMGAYVEAFVADHISEEQAETWTSPIESVLKTCEPVEDVASLDDF